MTPFASRLIVLSPTALAQKTRQHEIIKLVILKSLTLTLLLVCSVSAAQPAPVLQGSWSASAGPAQGFRGTWSADVVPGTPNAARGGWTLVNAANQIVAQGVWSARKSVGGWRGTWSAQIQTGRSPSGRATFGRSFAGTWQADGTDAQGRTLAEILRHTLEKEVGGAWQSGARAGRWSVGPLR